MPAIRSCSPSPSAASLIIAVNRLTRGFWRALSVFIALVALYLAAMVLGLADFSVVAGGTCSLSVPLANGESCTVLVRFRPTTGGARSGLLSFWDNTIVGRIDVALAGSGDDLCGSGCF